ncbi:MAG: type II toxin-antitoxin system PemK/MazF family toxin [Calditrichaeota bacterium]|nr:MAG: type II toxin-antitoxin system PemK/MazF family toxin [Calditrichota bacterium]
MKCSGQVVLFRFPYTDLKIGKLRPALLLKKLPGGYGDWLICMISSQTQQFVPGFDELIDENASDFISSGLKVKSIIRVGRLAVVNEEILVGKIGEIAADRLKRIQSNLASWILSS